MGTVGPPDDDAPDGASPPFHVELPTVGRPKVHDPFGAGGGGGFAPFAGRGGGGAFAAFPGALPSDRAWPPAAALFFGLEAIGLGTAEGSEALPDKQARIGEQQGAAGQECCGFVTSIS